MPLITGSDDPDKAPLEHVLELAFKAFMRGVHTGMPGRITEFDKKTCRATVRPLVQSIHILEDETQQVDTIADLHDVQVLFPVNTQGGLMYPVGVGTDVFLHFASCSLARIKQRGGVTDPGDTRRNHISDAIAYPAWFSFNLVPFAAPDDVVLQAAAGVKVKAGGATGTDAVPLAAAFLEKFGILVAAISTAVGTIPGGSTAAGDITTAMTNFTSAWDGVISQVFEAK